MKVFAVIASVFLFAVFIIRSATAQDGEATFVQPKYIFVTYIESLCRFSAKFITEQLYPNYDAIKEFVTVLVYSCGKVDIDRLRNGSVVQSCQHGTDECWGNKVQNCAMHKIEQEEDRVKFIYCSMSNLQIPIDYTECCTQVGVDCNDLYECANSDLGDALLKKCHDDSADYFAESQKVPVCVWGNSTHPPYDANAEAFMQQDFKQWVDYTHRVENSTAPAPTDATE